MAASRNVAKSIMLKSGSKPARDLSDGLVQPFKVAALYHFSRVADPASRQKPLLDLCLEQRIRGTLLLASEGINGTISGPDAGIDSVVQHIKGWDGFQELSVKYSTSTNGAGFHHMRIKLKPEIVTMGKPDIDPTLVCGTYVDPKDWNDLISRKDVAVVDTRNDYEIQIGKFKGAINPQTATFRDFPAWAEKLASEIARAATTDTVTTATDSSTNSSCTAVTHTGEAQSDSQQSLHASPPKAVAMYCTGGIRCEKATAYMKQLGVDQVYHLKGGILKYLEEIPQEQSLWEGECFVFDERVALKHNLEQGSYTRCFACLLPLSKADCELGKELYEEGVYCKHCVGTQTESQRERFRERQRQVVLARQRGEEHVGQRIAL